MTWTRVVVEDGTIVDGANSYIGETFFDGYITEVGYTTTATDEQQETAVIKACQYLNNLNYCGHKAEGCSIIMQFPRYGYTTIPEVLKNAQAWLACYLLDNPNTQLFKNNTGGLEVQSKTVGPISKSYFAPSDSIDRNKIRFDYIDDIMRDYIVIDKIMVG